MSVDYGNLSSHVRTGGGGEDFIDNLQPKGQYWLVSSCERLVRVSMSVSIARILLEVVVSINSVKSNTDNGEKSHDYIPIGRYENMNLRAETQIVCLCPCLPVGYIPI